MRGKFVPKFVPKCMQAGKRKLPSQAPPATHLVDDGDSQQDAGACIHSGAGADSSEIRPQTNMSGREWASNRTST